MANIIKTLRLVFVFQFLFATFWASEQNELDLDPNGYILYCPCMGRFGNQADHFLGALSFAHGLNKTLVLPPWVEYKPRVAKSIQVPFDTYFQVEPLRQYHRVITMETFMKELAPQIWPPGKRTSFCYMARSGGGDEQSCNAKNGNPFGPFWDTFNIDFDSSEFFGPLSYDTHVEKTRKNWLKKFPIKEHYVMAFTGAPGSFPVSQSNVELHQYLQWSDAISTKVDEFMQKNKIERPLLGLHMRHGSDWERACEHVGGSKRHLFASAQCLGFGMEHGSVTQELCLPPKDLVLAQIKETVKETKAKTIFVASDSDKMIPEISQLFKNKIRVLTADAGPHLDLALLARADYHIGNCISTFSAFAVRERRANGKPVSFWAFNSEPTVRNEL